MPTDNILARLKQWHTGKTAGPWYITLFPTNRCNLRCQICWQRGAEGLEKTRELSDERWFSIVDEAAALGAREWCIIGGGEPLMRGELVLQICKRICDHGMRGILQTNGTLLNGERIRHLVEMGWARINVSLDGPTREINDEIRSGSSFDLAVRNVREIARVKEELGTALPLVQFYTVITSTNFDKLDDMVRLAHETGCGGIVLTTLVTHSPEGKRFELTEDQTRALPEHLTEAKELAKQLAISNNFHLYLDEKIAKAPNSMRKDLDDDRIKGVAGVKCYEPWLSMAITADGVTGPCCAFWDPEANSLADKSVRDVWLGPYLTTLRTRLVEGNAPGYCLRCPSILFERTEQHRPDLQWEVLSPMDRIRFFMRKARRSVGRHGVLRAAGRGCLWTINRLRSR